MRHIKHPVRTLSTLLLLLVSGIAFSQNLTRQQYIDQYAKMAIQEMNEYHIPASITMAQACLESADGNSTLAQKANNHFGIKCNKNWNGPSMLKDDDAKNECFRKYSNPLESYRDHSEFLVGSVRYQFLFDYDLRDYKKWAHGLKKAGYATDPGYAYNLIKIIEDFNLHELDGYFKSSKTYTPRHTGGTIASNAARHRRITGGFDGFTIDPYVSRKVERRNGAKAFIASQGDTWEGIAQEFSLRDWEITKYNDLRDGEPIGEGTVVYLQSKRGSAPRGNDFHIMKQGESLWSVAQWYGVRLRALERKNRLAEGQKPVVGQRISLRKKVRN